MCFGSKEERNDDPPPRPVQIPPQDQPKTSRYQPQYTPGGQSSATPATEMDYRPPAGPPPGKGGEEYAPPSGPPPGRQQEKYAPPSGPPPSQQQHQGYDYTAPPGPPPGRQDWDAPPSGPPPSHQQYQSDYAPPSGPPPSNLRNQDFAPPPGPPPSQQPQLQPWEIAVPDTSLFPPPPAIFSGFERSPATNATEQEAIAGEDWCNDHPLTQPMVLNNDGKQALYANNFRMMEPAGFNGKLQWLSSGRWEVSTARNTPDRCLISYPPLYVVNEHDPLRYGKPKTIYYEVKIARDTRELSIAMGFTALPYPSFRMPGWHRGSLAVHGDDGHKYINDRWGGKEFTSEFRRGETVGLGMTFRPVGAPKPQVDIFFTRNGQLTDGWALHEEIDAETDLPVTGLEGLHDLSCVVGTYDSVKFEVVFDPSRWMYNPFEV